MADEDPLALRFSAAPGHLLRRAQQVHTDYWSRAIAEDITGPQYATLVSVAGWPEVDQKMAGELASLDKSTAAGVVARLEKKGWVSRRRHPDDARRRLLVLTEHARRRLPALTAGAAEVQRLLLQPLAERDRLEFLSLLQRVAFPDPNSAVGTAPLHNLDVLEMATTPGYLIRRAQQIHAAVWMQIFAGDLTSPQYAVLTAVATADTDTVDQAQICLRASLDSSSVTDIVARLEEKGWITRQRDQGDRRRMRIALTLPAVTAMRHLTRSVEQVQNEVLRALDARQRDQFISLMQQVALIERDPMDRLPVGAR